MLAENMNELLNNVGSKYKAWHISHSLSCGISNLM